VRVIPAFLAAVLVSCPLWCGAQVSFCLTTRGDVVVAVRGEDLRAAAPDPASLPSGPAMLESKDGPVAVRLIGLEDGRWDPGDLLLFHAPTLEDRYSDENTFRLTLGGRAGPVMELVPPLSGTAAPLSFVWAEVHLEENHVYDYFLFHNTSQVYDHWMWGLALPDKPFAVTLEAADALPGVPGARLEVGLRGRSSAPEVDPDHRVTIDLNGKAVVEATWDGQIGTVARAELPPGSVNPGANELRIRPALMETPKASNQVCLDWIRLRYPRALTAPGSICWFGTPDGDGPVSIPLDGVSGQTAQVYDVTDPARTLFCGELAIRQGAALGLPGGTGRRYVTVAENGFAKPTVRLWRDAPDLTASGMGADYLIISPGKFGPALDPLVRWHEGHGLRVRLALLEQVYDQFGFGRATPEAIRAFVLHARSSWNPAPRFLLLVGDANSDYRDHLHTGVKNELPTYVAPSFGSVEAAADCYFGREKPEDGGSDLATGRFPVRTPEEVSVMVAKTIAYGDRRAPEGSAKLAFVIDSEIDAPGRIQEQSESMMSWCKALGCAIDRVATGEVSLAGLTDRGKQKEAVRAALLPKIIAMFRAGPALLNFRGHGGTGYWTRENIFNVGDVAALTGTPTTVVLNVSCFTGEFDSPREVSVTEALLLARDGGAVACIAPSRLGGQAVDADFVERILLSPGTAIGEAFAWAVARRAGDRPEGFFDPVDNYNLLGDPALKVRAPKREPTPVQ